MENQSMYDFRPEMGILFRSNCIALWMSSLLNVAMYNVTNKVAIDPSLQVRDVKALLAELSQRKELSQ